METTIKGIINFEYEISIQFHLIQVDWIKLSWLWTIVSQSLAKDLNNDVDIICWYDLVVDGRIRAMRNRSTEAKNTTLACCGWEGHEKWVWQHWVDEFRRAELSLGGGWHKHILCIDSRYFSFLGSTPMYSRCTRFCPNPTASHLFLCSQMLGQAVVVCSLFCSSCTRYMKYRWLCAYVRSVQQVRSSGRYLWQNLFLWAVSLKCVTLAWLYCVGNIMNSRKIKS